MEVREVTNSDNRLDILEWDTLENVGADIINPTVEDIAEIVSFCRK